MVDRGYNNAYTNAVLRYRDLAYGGAFRRRGRENRGPRLPGGRGTRGGGSHQYYTQQLFVLTMFFFAFQRQHGRFV